LYEINGYSSGYEIHGSQVVNTWNSKTKRADEIMENLITSHTDLTVLNFVDASALTPINYVGKRFIIPHP